MSYDYRVAGVRRVVSGDTLDLIVDVGFYLTATLRFRLKGVDTPELADSDPDIRAKAAEATVFVQQWLNERDARARTHKADGFGLWLAEVYDVETGEDLGQALMDGGFAQRYER